MKLTPRQISELSKLTEQWGITLWGGVPPERADPNLSFYIHEGLVEWIGRGYRITDKGRAAIGKEGEGDE